MLIKLMHDLGFDPQKASSTNGGEFHSACPNCGGTDRFIIWPKTERYWCRQCKKSGDAIQFNRDFMNMSFNEACLRIGHVTKLPVEQKHISGLLQAQLWEEKAQDFIKRCHNRLLVDLKALDCIMRARGLSLDTLKRYSIGWSPVALFSKREEWGLEKKVENGKEKKLWLPSGVVIPSYQENSLCKIKFRRDDWQEGDKFGKYYILPGSIDCISVFGNPLMEIVVVVEAEFDAMLVAQEAESLYCCIALGGAQKRPDVSLHQWLQQKKLIIFALDFDEAGKREYPYWHSNYINLVAWPVPLGKSPAEAWKLGVDLKKWVLSGVQYKNG